MIVRIVQLRFRESEISSFLANFEQVKNGIRNSPGCTFLEVYRDKKDPQTFFTYSHWNAESDLENYRNSDFFKEVWAVTKTKFAAKPEAWTLDSIARLD